jgi:predicted transcriptional regulator
VISKNQRQSELDSVLGMVENPVRRSIVKRLSQEPSYPLQLSKELRLGQQLIAKHLAVLEEAGLVASSMEPSPNGPERKEYSLKRSISLTLDFAPNLYSERLVSLDHSAASATDLKRPKENSVFFGRIERILRSANESGRIGLMGKVIGEIDDHIRNLEDERVALLYIRNYAMNEAAKLVRGSNKNTDSRRVMYHILDSHDKNVSEISESVNLREETVREIVRGLEKDLKI